MQVCTYTAEVHMGPIVKNELSTFDLSHTDFHGVADLEMRSVLEFIPLSFCLMVCLRPNSI